MVLEETICNRYYEREEKSEKNPGGKKKTICFLIKF